MPVVCAQVAHHNAGQPRGVARPQPLRCHQLARRRSRLFRVHYDVCLLQQTPRVLHLLVTIITSFWISRESVSKGYMNPALIQKCGQKKAESIQHSEAQLLLLSTLSGYMSNAGDAAIIRQAQAPPVQSSCYCMHHRAAAMRQSTRCALWGKPSPSSYHASQIV